MDGPRGAEPRGAKPLAICGTSRNEGIGSEDRAGGTRAFARAPRGASYAEPSRFEATPDRRAARARSKGRAAGRTIGPVVTSIVPDSAKLRSALRALPPAEKDQIRAKRHPWIGRPRMVILGSSSLAGEKLVRRLVDEFGECWWYAGRWRTKKTQLRLPGM